MNVGGSYDESLLREAPAATREQLQVNNNRISSGLNSDQMFSRTYVGGI
jgi:hypothetical protein